MSSQEPYTPQQASPTAYLVLLVGVLAVSTASIFIRFAQSEVPSLVIATYRMALAGLLLAPAALWRSKQIQPTLEPAEKRQVLLAGLLLAFHFASWIASLELTTVVNSVVLVTTAPLWVAAASPVLLKEPVSRNAFVGLGLALVGGVLVGLSSICSFTAGGIVCQEMGNFFQGKAALGNLLALMGAWFSAGYLVVGRRVRKKLHLMTYTFRVYGTAGLTLLAVTLLFGLALDASGGTNVAELLFDYSPISFVWMILLALIPQMVGHTAFNWSLAYLPAAFVSVALLGEPVGSTILAILFLHESPTVLQFVGAGFILAGIMVASRQTAE